MFIEHSYQNIMWKELTYNYYLKIQAQHKLYYFFCSFCNVYVNVDFLKVLKQSLDLISDV